VRLCSADKGGEGAHHCAFALVNLKSKHAGARVQLLCTARVAHHKLAHAQHVRLRVVLRLRERSQDGPQREAELALLTHLTRTLVAARSAMPAAAAVASAPAVVTHSR